MNGIYGCNNLSNVSFPLCSTIGSFAFAYCYKLISLYLLGPTLVSLYNINAFLSTPFSDNTTSTGGIYGKIYVPSSLYNSYLTAKNWSQYSARIVSV